MHPITILLLLFFAIPLQLFGEVTTFSKYNFSIDRPTLWESASSPPENTIGLIKSADKTKSVIILAFKFAEDKRDTALADMVGGAKKSASAQGIEIKGERKVLIDGVPFEVFTFKVPSGASVVSYMGVAGNMGYSLQGYSLTTDAGSDEQLSSIFNSFRLLNPKSSKSSPNIFEIEASAFGEIVGTAAMIAFVIGLAWIIISKQRKQKASVQE